MDASFFRALACLPALAVTLDGTLSALAGEDDDGEDHISALPDDLRRNIVSRLPVRDAVRTTTLSTLWRRVWHSTPLLFYDEHVELNDERARLPIIHRVLAGHPGPFHTVQLCACFFNEHESEVALYARLLADKQVRDLFLVNQPGYALRLPAGILRSSPL
ncbi:hypothetical protein ACP4OV_011528 [Aristida adscensionis]